MHLDYHRLATVRTTSHETYHQNSRTHEHEGHAKPSVEKNQTANRRAHTHARTHTHTLSKTVAV